MSPHKICKEFYCLSRGLESVYYMKNTQLDYLHLLSHTNLFDNRMDGLEIILAIKNVV
jgi:hypothetical protein